MTHYLVTITPDGTLDTVPHDPAQPSQIENLIGTDLTHHSGHPRGIEEIEIITDDMGHLLHRNSAPNPVATIYSGRTLTGRAVVAGHNPDTAETTGLSPEETDAVLREIRALTDLSACTARPPGTGQTYCDNCDGPMTPNRDREWITCPNDHGCCVDCCPCCH